MKITNFEEDLLDLEEFSHRLENFIATEQEYVDGSLVVALTSKYGSGKTTFLEMWRTSLECDVETSDKPLVISLNAWESDYYGDPLFAIISALVECLQAKGTSVDGLVNAAKDFGWFATAIANQIINKVTGIDAVAAGGIAKKKKEDRKETAISIPDSFSVYRGRKAAMKTLKEELESIVAASEPIVIFLVDELDRCRPDYAITYLETIKHIFDIKGAVFLLAADRQQLENSARTAFGQKLDFEEYYRKFIHREIPLPSISKDGYKNLASEYVGFYLEKEKARHCFMELEHHRVEDISNLVGALKLTPRQIQEVFRVLGHVFSTEETNKGRLRWCLAVGSIFMAAMKIGDPKMYHLLGTQQLECEEVGKYLERLLSTKNAEWWFLLLLTGDGLRKNDGEAPIDSIKRAGFSNENDDLNMHDKLVSFSQGWGHLGHNRIREIHEKIEQIFQWK